MKKFLRTVSFSAICAVAVVAVPAQAGWGWGNPWSSYYSYSYPWYGGYSYYSYSYPWYGGYPYYGGGRYYGYPWHGAYGYVYPNYSVTPSAPTTSSAKKAK